MSPTRICKHKRQLSAKPSSGSKSDSNWWSLSPLEIDTPPSILNNTHSCSGTGGNKKEDKEVGATEVNYVDTRATPFVTFTDTFTIHLFSIFACEH
mmetsp:Transcript_103043/g.177745  ORF Transcript_103043/g.177745 Transcript_103043/m.177745 type:complete len:96 (-) Transcript_103043:47-334(-)